jgi:hypothetical protein
MLTFAYPWLQGLIVLPWLLHWVLPAYRQTMTVVVVPLLNWLAALTGQQSASGAVIVKPPLIQQVFLWAVWFCPALWRPRTSLTQRASASIGSPP